MSGKRILLLPGLGDIHWTLVKLRGWLAKRGWDAEPPELSIWDVDNRPRSIDYFDLVPWCRRGEYAKIPLVGKPKQVFDALYLHPGSPDYALDFCGYDALVGLNGNMRHGRPFAGLLEGAPADFAYGPRLAQPQPRSAILSPGTCEARPAPEKVALRASREATERPYFVLCFSDYGMFANSWCGRVGAERVKGLLRELRRAFPRHRLLLTGCAWDSAFSKALAGVEGVENVVGETSLVEFLWLLKHARGYVGWCGGNSIVAQHLGVPTVVWWSKLYFPSHDRRGWETPGARHAVLEVEDFVDVHTPRAVSKFLAEAGA